MKNLVVACLLSAICCACRKLRKRRRRGLSPLIDPSSPQLHPMQRERRRLRQLPHRRRSCCHPPAEDAPAEGAPAQPGPAGDPRHVHRAGARSPALPAELHQHEAGGVHGHRLRERQVSMGVQGVLSNRRMSFEMARMTMRCSTPQIRVDTEYFFNGTIMVLPLYGNGTGSIVFGGSRGTIAWGVVLMVLFSRPVEVFSPV
jgi:hypothetical protein